ncbi:hypothetical protein BJ741DRAFT_670965 [Chytriomyces cf. hyalinus JEL632]|nr:hypothetical protein BJ741DRAFT_670965 [Chytriomyces cf. hyalinus JEL632]
MSSKRLISSAHRLVLTAAPRQVTLRVTFPTGLPAATATPALDSLTLSLTCPSLSKSSFLEHLDLFRDKDTAKENGKTTPGPLPHVSAIVTTPSLGTSFKNVNSFSSQQAQPTNTPVTAAEADATKSTVQTDEDNLECDKDNCDNNEKYELGYIEDNLNGMPVYNPLQGYTAGQVLENFNPFIVKKFPYLRKAINEWFEILRVPKVYLDPAKKSGGIFDF